MVALSKPTLLKYSCYELGHTWHPSCKQASLDVLICVFKQAIKIYGSLYLLAGVVRKRGKNYFKKKVWQEILQSTLFLTTNGTLFITCFCIWRKLAGFYFYPSAILCGVPSCAVSLAIERKERNLFKRVQTYAFAFEPAFVGSLTAILVERKSRRGLLAVYMANVALETLWRMLAARGYVKAIPNGEVLLFSVAAAVYLYYFKKSKGLPQGTLTLFKIVADTLIYGTPEANRVDPYETAPTGAVSSGSTMFAHTSNYVTMRKVFGSEEILEAPSENAEGEEVEERPPSSHNQHTQENGVGPSQSRDRALHTQVIHWLKGCPSHRLCQHRHSCCYYILEGTLRMFGVGYVAQGVIKLVGSLPKFLKHPKTVIQALVSKNNVQLGAFLGCFVGVYRAVNCLLRWVREKDEQLHGLVAGFLAGWSLVFYRSQTIALYTAAKMAELLYFKGIEHNMVPYIRCADIIIYSISTAIVFHAAVLEPHNLRPAYWNFLLKVTEGRFGIMNRRLLDPWVPNCSKIAPDFWPDYDMRYTNLVKPS